MTARAGSARRPVSALLEVSNQIRHDPGCCGSDCSACKKERGSRPATLERLLTARQVPELLGFAAGSSGSPPGTNG